MNSADKKRFKVQSHRLKPVVIIGQSGLSDAVLSEIKLALLTHQLIKIKIHAEREQRQQLSAEICLQTHAELIQSIGQMSVIYKYNPDK